MKKVVSIVILILTVAILYNLQISLYDWFNQSGERVRAFQEFRVFDLAVTSLLGSLIFGFIIGSTSCPTCSLPLIGYIMGAEATAKKAFWSSLIFHIGRLMTFFIIGVAIAVLGYSIPTNLSVYTETIAGVIMIFFSMELFDIINVSSRVSQNIVKRIRIPIISANNPAQLLVWGLIVGLGCSAGYVVPIIAVILETTKQGLLYTAIAVGLFSLGTMITPTTILVITGGSVELAGKYTQGGITKYAKWIGGLLLLFVGLLYVMRFIFMTI